MKISHSNNITDHPNIFNLTDYGCVFTRALSLFHETVPSLYFLDFQVRATLRLWLWPSLFFSLRYIDKEQTSLSPFTTIRSISKYIYLCAKTEELGIREKPLILLHLSSPTFHHPLFILQLCLPKFTRLTCFIGRLFRKPS